MEDNKKKPLRIGKKGIAAIIVAAVLIIAVIVTSVYVSNNKIKVYSDIIYTLMDKEKLAEDGSNRLLHIRKNPEFDAKAKNATLLDAFEVYYNDESGKEYSFKADDKIMSDDQEIGADMVILAFEASALEKLNPIKSVAAKIAIVVVVIVIVGLIFLWYKIWSKKEDEEKARRLEKTNQKKK